MTRETRVHRRSLIEWGRKDPTALVLSGDLTAPCEADGFEQAFPDRFISMGLMEQNMMSFAAGLAREGYSPLVHTFAVFMYRRALDQVEMSIAYGDMPVRMFGFLPGVTTPGGPSHQATNDIAVMRSLPNVSVVEVGDATDIEGLYDLSQQVDGPLYIRMLRGEVSRLFAQDEPIKFNSARLLSEGSDIALLTSGVCTEEALRVTGLLREAGISIRHMHVSTIKPFTDPQVVETIKEARLGVVVMENHGAIGGLGSCVADLIAEQGLGKRLIKVTTGDRYLQGASQQWLMENYGIGAINLVEAVEELTGRSSGIEPDKIAAAAVSDFVDDKQMEAL
ncbi:transketolase [Rhodobacteraceae bacterium NNCM2]|nr:transketolase [Coraliihabitans acroporae]